MLVSPWRSLDCKREPSASFINRHKGVKKVTYSANLWGSTLEYLFDNFLVYAGAKLVFKTRIRSFVQDTLSSMSVVFATN